MNERERAIEARVNAATPGEWNRDTHPQEPIIASRTEGETWYSIAPVCQVCYGDWTEGDAEFIAAAPADIRYLLARVAALEAALTPFAEVGAAVAALRDVRPQSSYAPEHAALTIGGATVTFADLIAAAAFENQRDLIKALTALEPFAALAPQIRLSVQNSNVMYAYNDTLITAGDFRRAALAVEAHPAPESGQP